MKLTVRLTALLCLVCGLSFADSWSGVLVDSKCYAAEERNVNPDDTDTSVDRDRNFELRYCHPTPRAKSFAIVLESGEFLKLDSASDAKAAEIARNGNKKSNVFVAVTGERNKRTIQVNSISLVR